MWTVAFIDGGDVSVWRSWVFPFVQNRAGKSPTSSLPGYDGQGKLPQGSVRRRGNLKVEALGTIVLTTSKPHCLGWPLMSPLENLA